ncbi:response regulator transcription factor [Telmatospirillum sp. J64-1]|uniref:response regulator transcription factor n=1 Tax=Telmatospirillum sp. J64-1 TaxID=2502183 RepID=UPI00115C6793|nr:response regulator transcription factor [Telmatospirillum sp. J64-1]
MQILIADDHNLVREGLKPFLHELSGDAEVLEAATLDEALEVAAGATALRLVLLDLKMPGMKGLDGVVRLCREVPGVPVVILTGHIHRDDVLAAIRAGAAGYIPKTISGAGMINALRLVLSGEKFLPSSVFSDDEISDSPPILTSAAANGRRAEGESPLSALSNREAEILGYLIQGHTNKEIARVLDLQEITIKIHLRNVYRKIGAANRAQAVRIALSSGWELHPLQA